MIIVFVIINNKMKISSTQFKNIAKRTLNCNGYSVERRHCAFFGVSSFLTSKLCDLIEPICDLHSKYWPKYLLWMRMFLKQYNTEDVLAATVGITTKPLRFWVWLTVDGIANKSNKVVSNKNHYFFF